jgi:hypothetical protein
LLHSGYNLKCYVQRLEDDTRAALAKLQFGETKEKKEVDLKLIKTMKQKKSTQKAHTARRQFRELGANYLILFGSPKGNRTPVSAVRGRYPRPLDDGTLAGGEGFEPSLTGPEPVVLPLNDPPASKRFS